MKERSPEELLEENQQLQDRVKGYERRLGKFETPYPSNRIHDFSEFFKGHKMRIALISDTHLGSRLERLEDLQAAYKIMEREKVQACYHSGDLLAGQSVYKGQENEVKVWGFDDQVDYFINNYPESKKFKTSYISGNHDLSFLSKAGADPGIKIAEARDDLEYLGQVEADVLIAPNIKLRLWHGGRPSYARSYTQQKYLDGIEGGNKPDILAAGHLHVAFQQDYRNVMAFNVGAFERQTLFLKRLGITPSCSFWILDIHQKEGSINRLRSELVKFY